MNGLACCASGLRLKGLCLGGVVVIAALVIPSYVFPGRFVRAQDNNLSTDAATARDAPVELDANQEGPSQDAGLPIPSSQPDASDSRDGATSPDCDQAVTVVTHGQDNALRAQPAAVINSGARPLLTTDRGRYGLGADFGLSGPLLDAGLLLAWRPFRWIKVQAGPGYNGIAFGARGGVTVVNPVSVPLSLTCEGGRYFEGDANRVVRIFRSNAQEIGSLRHFSYDYLNLLAGLEFGGKNFCVYLRGGISWMRTTIKDLAQSAHDFADVDLQASDPKVSYRGPTLKLGTQYFF
jgi:hypothetical protein